MLRTTSFPGLSYEDEGRDEKALVCAISKPEPAILCGGLLRLWETPAKVGL
jgi:hypothetical protein